MIDAIPHNKMKNRTARDWIIWAENHAKVSHKVWRGRGVDYWIATKLLAEKCEELQVELAEMKVLLCPSIAADTKSQNNGVEKETNM